MSARFFLPALLFVVGCVPIALALHFMHAYWVPLPYWDEWFTPAQQLISLHQGTLSLPELFRQHNESRPFFPRLVMLLLAAPAGWDVRQEMVASFVTVCAGAGLLYLLLRQNARLAPPPRMAAWAAAVFLLFSPGGYENFLNARHFGNFIPGVALLCALAVNLSRRSLAAKTGLNAGLAFIATYSMPHGLFLWLFAWPLASPEPDESRRPWLWRAIYLGAALLSIVGYFWTYQHPTGTPAFVSPLTHPGLLFHYLALWCGGLFFLSATNPLLRGLVVLALFLGLAGAAICKTLRDRNWRDAYPWLALGFFTLLSGLTAAAGRLGFGLPQALDQRYTSYTVLLYVAIVGLAATLLPRRAGGRIAVVALLAVGAILWGESLARVAPRLAADERMRRHFLLALRWAAVIPDNPELRKITPYPETPRRIQQLISADILRPRAITGPLAETVRGQPAQAAVPAIGHLVATPTGTPGLLEVEASAKKADCIILGLTTSKIPFRPVAVLANHEPELVDLTRFRDRRGQLSGWAVFLRQKRALPLGGTIAFDPTR